MVSYNTICTPLVIRKFSSAEIPALIVEIKHTRYNYIFLSLLTNTNWMFLPSRPNNMCPVSSFFTRIVLYYYCSYHTKVLWNKSEMVLRARPNLFTGRWFLVDLLESWCRLTFFYKVLHIIPDPVALCVIHGSWLLFITTLFVCGFKHITIFSPIPRRNS